MFVTPGFAQEAPPAAGELQTEVVEVQEESGFPPFETATYPSQILWLALTFGLFYLFLQKVVLPRIGSILEVRRDRIAHDLDQAAHNKEEADAAVAAYEQELADARAKAHAIAREAQDAAKADAEAERRSVEADLERKLAEAETRIAGIKQSSMEDVGTIAEEAASEIVEALIGSRPDDAAVSAAVTQAR